MSVVTDATFTDDDRIVLDERIRGFTGFPAG